MNLSLEEHYGILNSIYINKQCWNFLILADHCDPNVLDYYDRIEEQKFLSSAFTHVVWKSKNYIDNDLCGIKRMKHFANFLFLSSTNNILKKIQISTILGMDEFKFINYWTKSHGK